MSKLLFRTDKKHTAVIDEDAMDLEPDIRNINAKQKLCLILYVDYFSPFARLSEQERLIRAKRQVFGKEENNFESDKKVIKAIEAYKALQYDYRREMVRNYQLKIKELSDSVVTEKNLKNIPVTQAAIDVLHNNAKKIQAEIDALEAEEEDNLKGGSSRSFIEKWQENQREYKKNKTRQTV